MRVLLFAWLAAAALATLASARPASLPQGSDAKPAQSAPAKPAQQGKGAQPAKGAGGKQGAQAPGAGKQQPGKPGAGKQPGKQGPGKQGPGKGGAGKGKAGAGKGKAGAAPKGGVRAGQRARTQQKPARPESARPELASLASSGDPIGLALSEDGKQVFSMEGTALCVLDAQKPNLPELKRVAVDANVLDLACIGKTLYLAGGTSGVGVIEFETAAPKPAVAGSPATRPAPHVQWLDRHKTLPCTSIAATDQLLLATFASDRASELRIYLRGAKKLVGSVKTPGRALDIAVRQSFAYLAMGQYGVLRADLHFLKQPKLERGPDLTTSPVPESFKLRRGFVREVAVAGNSLYVAADITGLVEIDLTKPWGTTESANTKPLVYLGRPAYAVRVDARGEHVAVGSARIPALVGDGAPYGLLGGMGWDFSIGDVPASDWPPGAAEVLWIFRHPRDGALELAAIQPIEESTWREIAIAGRRVYEQHGKLGLVVRELAANPRLAQVGNSKVPLDGSVAVVGKHKPRGLACLDGKPSLVDPRLLFFGVDPNGVDGHGFLRMGQDEQLRPVPELAALGPIGTNVGAQWPDALASTEWFLSSGTHGWRVQRFAHRPKPMLTSWDLVPPEPLDATQGGGRGRATFQSTGDGDLILATRDGTRFGLVGYSTKQLSRIVAETKPGGRVLAKPLWQVPTHFEGEKGSCSTWRARVFSLEDGRRIVAIAAGANTNPESEHHQRPQLVLYDVTNGTASPPKYLAVAWGEEKESLAVAVDVCQMRRRSVAVVATTGGELLVFDVNDPTKPRLVRSFKAPESAYDGRRDPLLDVEIATEASSGRCFAYLAGGRAGFLRVELTASGDDLAADTVLDTPGWASGVVSTLIGQERYWLVGDQRGGLRLYR
jgi:hypothetical protein